ncbi:CocE/NonD family hydrolase C-terminal non-catalytic domain-containing protein [Blastococcus sp. BMG 814]|uniref:CocE/NonD family hydrolase C-terminal non-catalytic domain-containing protein n=1 Tax=Blastococcus carthaginiensis TaxID=3050034 RepID=A0ABT9I9S5_9ACTN|nr:CocE/NonD family hydrolase C-terminal non-catalytic domain-containing protein [Blastococcus carthaginiensis]MDP5182316.1 CocE/NonD family hydrolase C-terminal non-catalytic domain-containing protein [Blastococcus carthaginiensis]
MDVLRFTGPPPAEALEVVGVPVVEVAHHSETPHADLFVRIREVDPKGLSRNVNDGYIRLDAASADDVVRLQLDAMGELQPETTQAAPPKGNGLVIGVELRGLEPLTPTLPGRHDRVRQGPPKSEKAL